MSLKFKFAIYLISVLLNISCYGQPASTLQVGAEQPELYLSKLQGKKVALMVNQTSLANGQHLIDFLINQQVDVLKIFAVEHGFRGEAANGEELKDGVDSKTGIPVISLYGEKKKAASNDLTGIDVVIFDIQDVGCRFYTYISSLYLMMETCAENQIKLLVLDRPNPNGDYVDGPVLDMNFKSFVGMLPVPIVHGCTVGEMAQMINGEKWLKDGIQCNLEVIPVKNYTHSTHYSLPVKPSPNLPNDLAVRLYPSLCFFEATNVSIGRGTAFPFQVIGFPESTVSNFSFTPQNIEGVSLHPIFEGKQCNGIDLRNLEEAPKFTLSYFIQFSKLFKNQSDFWKSKRWIELLSGNDQFYNQINEGWSEEEIKSTWQPQLSQYLKLRKQYLLYPDFE